MHSSTLFFAAALVVAPLSVLAHGEVRFVSSGGVTMDGPNIYYDPDPKNSQTPVRKMLKSSEKAFLLPPDFSNSNMMACEGAGPAPKNLKVAAGDHLTIHWEGATGELDGIGGVNGYHPWVHAMGSVIDYITSCNGDCSSFNAADAGWTKLAGAGIDMGQSISGNLRNAMTRKPEKYYPLGQGKWAMAKLVEQGSSWDINIPKGLKSGQYIVRHEITAVHNPLNGDPTSGPQMYVACVNVEVTGGGSTSLPAGTKAGDLYQRDGAFAKFNVYSGDIGSFKVPGPAVWDGVTGGDANIGSNDNSGNDSSPPPPSSNSNSNSGSPKPEPKPASSTPKADPSTPKAASTPAKPPPSADSAPPPATTPKAPSAGQCKAKRRRSRRSHF